LKQSPAPRDLAFFLEHVVFPGVDHRLLVEALSCSKLVYLPEGEEKRLAGIVVVYAGSVRVGEALYARGDYAVVDGPVAAVKDSILIYFPGDCGRVIEAGLRGAETCVVDDLVHRPPVCVEPGTSCIDAVRVMASHGVSSVLVCRGGRAEAIFTDTDLRRIVARHGAVPPGRRVEDCGTRNPLGVPQGTPCTEAALVMMERYVKHLVVYSDGAVRGVVTVRDIAYAEALGPLYARRLLAPAQGVEGLTEAYRRVLRLLRRSLARLQPSTSPRLAEHNARMASLALRAVVEKAAEIAFREAGVSGGASYAVAGSLARQEQPLPTDRDSLLLYDPRRLAEEDAKSLAGRVEEILDSVGFPGCSHGYTSRRLVYSVEELPRLAARLAEDPAGNVVEIGLLLDAVDVWPREAGSAARLRRLLVEKIAEAGSGPALRAALAAYRPRLGVLGRLPRRLDLKRGLLAPLSYAAKALAASGGLWEEVNTGRRLLALTGAGALPPDLAEDAVQAYQVGLGYAAWSLAAHGSREIDTASLSGYERQLLRAALNAAARLVDRARQPL